MKLPNGLEVQVELNLDGTIKEISKQPSIDYGLKQHEVALLLSGAKSIRIRERTYLKEEDYALVFDKVPFRIIYYKLE